MLNMKQRPRIYYSEAQKARAAVHEQSLINGQ